MKAIRGRNSNALLHGDSNHSILAHLEVHVMFIVDAHVMYWTGQVFPISCACTV
jgi:hypothetical protein